MKAYSFSFVKLVFFFFVYLSLTINVSAQDVILVSGRVVDKGTKKPFTDEAVFVYGFNTVGEAEDAKKELDAQTGKFMEAAATEFTDGSGNYEIRVASTGALLFKAGVADCVMEKVNERFEINVSIDAGIVLEAVEITGTLQDIKPTPKAPTIIGNKLLMYNTFTIPGQFGKPNARLIIQPFVMDCETEDTIAFARPLIYDGSQYRMTQYRRMGYDFKNDPLSRFVSLDTLTNSRMVITWADTVAIPDPTRAYHGNAIIQLEDYTNAYFNKTTPVVTCDAKRPLKFLEYSLGQYDLDPAKYRERAKREKRNTSQNISLTFLVNKAELNPEDSTNVIQLNKLKSDLLDIVNGEGSTLKEFHITGISSPEGSYQKNLDLSRERVKFAQQQITSVLPQRVLARVYQNPHAEVATWADVADLMEADSLKAEAAEIRNIVERYKSQDAQYAQVMKLPNYRTSIRDHFPELRKMRFEYKHEIFRELTPEEIMDRYTHDKDYRSGKKSFALYEYWHLFNMVKDAKELEELYRRAYKDSKSINGTPWILAANNLAVSYLRRDTFDVAILEPFIDRKTRGSNIVRKRMDGVTSETINPEELIANQLGMFLKANNFEQASVMAQILPNTEKNAKIKAFAMCLGGYYKGGNTPEERAESRKVFDLVKDSSPLNEVVMYLALESKGGDIMAEKAAKELPITDPKTWYLKAIINNRKGELNFEQAKDCLIECFKIDEKYMKTAGSDGDIGKDLYEYTIEMYQLAKEMNQLNQGGGF